MAYFGGGGVEGTLHPSLQAYIDCFHSAPLPKMYPRGGGPWDQDPILMQHFRAIRTFEVKWKESQSQHSQLQGPHDESAVPGGAPDDLEELLNNMLEEHGLDEDQFF